MDNDEKFKWFLLGFMISAEGHNAEWPYTHNTKKIVEEKRNTFESCLDGNAFSDKKSEIESELFESP